MHYFQQRYLRENAAFVGLAGLLTVDLPNKGLLSGIELRVWGVCGADTTDPDVWLHDRLTKVEVIVNGSQVVKSYDARQLLAMMLYKKTPHYSHDYKNMSSAACEEYFYINLGRDYHDLEYMLDLGQVADPELRIEYNFGMASCAGFLCGTAMTAAPRYSVICHLLRDTEVVPKGYIKTSEIHRVTNVVNLNYNLTVPRGPTYSNLYLQSWWWGEGLTNILDHYEVNINSDDIIPIRTRIQPMIAAIVRMYGLQEMTQQFYGVGGNPYPFPMEVGTMQGEIGLAVADCELRQIDLWGVAGRIPLRSVAGGGASVANPLLRTTIRGSMPFGVIPIPLFNPWDEKTWIDTSVLGDFWVRVELNALADHGVTKLLGDEVVTRYVTPSWP